MQRRPRPCLREEGMERAGELLRMGLDCIALGVMARL